MSKTLFTFRRGKFILWVMKENQERQAIKSRPRTEANFEVHIVGYADTDLSRAPKPYYLNEVAHSTQGISTIATIESNNLNKAYKQFELGSRWSERQLKEQDKFAAHVKLEAMKEQLFIDKPVLEKLPEPRLKQFTHIESPIVSAWDVHFDGHFDKRLKDYLHNDGYIVFNYISTRGEEISTLTMHFLRPEECIDEFKRITKSVQECGGFKGQIYYEDPLAFVVFGETIPRRIVKMAKAKNIYVRNFKASTGD